MRGAQSQLLARFIEFVDRAAARGKLHRARHDFCEHFSQIERRVDRLPDLCQRLEVLDGVGELLGARLQLLNRRTFSMAMTAWSAKVLTSWICFSENGSYLVRAE